ncbi:hypothetical protein ABN028_20015 [Actinopolymorpha sp. B17G11]|uniref:hypothetical protein n=1 Tax=Actinopolymorpha sp. B17G11 TaxID=3160861 RepID=UPI0032E3A1A8
MSVRLFDEAGNFLSHLPLVGEVSIQEVLNEEGAGTLRYSAASPGASLLTSIDDGQIAVSVDGYEVFRFLFEDDEDDPADAAGPAREITVAGPGALAALARAVITPAGGIGAKPAIAGFVDDSPGHIMRTLIGRAKALGYLPNVWTNFDADFDSAGQPWAKQMDIIYDAGKDLLTVAKDLAAQGVCDIRMRADPDQGDGLWLDMWNPGTALATDKPNVYLRRAHITKAPRKRSRKELRTDILVVGEGGANVVRHDPEARSRYGPRLGYLGWGNATKTATLNAAGDNALALASRPAVGYDFDLQLDHDTCPQPYSDFKVGDKIRSDYAPTSVGTGYEPLRVRQMTVTLNRDGAVDANIGCNDRFLESSLRLARKIEGVVHGTISNTGVGPPNKPRPDTEPPAAPTGVAQTAAIYTGLDGRSSVLAEVTWNAVTSNADGTVYDDFGNYRVSYRLPDRSQFWVGETTTTGLDVVFEGLPQGQRFQARVRAFDAAGNAGAFGFSPLITLPVDAGPPPIPSMPLLEARLGTLRVTWDGFDEDGAVMPRDLAHLEVHVSQTPDFTTSATTKMDSITGAPGSAVLTELDYNTTYYVRLIAVDNVGNRSLPSAEASAVIVPLVDTDIIGEIITGANIVPGTIVASDAIVANTITGGLIQALSIQTGHLAANAVTADKIQAGSITTEKLAASAVSADKIEAGTITADRLRFGTTLNLHPEPSFEGAGYRARFPASGPWLWETSTGSYDGSWRLKGTPTGSTAGFILAEVPVTRGERYYLSVFVKTTGTNGRSQLLAVWNDPDGSALSSSIAATAQFSVGNNWTKIEGNVVAPAGAGQMSVRVDMSNGASTGNWYWDLVEIRPVVGTTTTGGVSRVEASPLGVFMWDATGRQTVRMDAPTGAVSVVGEMSTGIYPARRLVMNPGNTGFAEMRFYPTDENTRYAFINSYDGVLGAPALGLNGSVLGDGDGMTVLLADDRWQIGRVNRTSLEPAGSFMRGYRDEFHLVGDIARWPHWSNQMMWGGLEPHQVNTTGFVVGYGRTMAAPVPAVLTMPFRGQIDHVNWLITARSSTSFTCSVTNTDGSIVSVNYTFSWLAFRPFT